MTVSTPARTGRPRPYRIRAWRARLSHDEWLSLRRTGLGSSDAPVLLGLSPFMSPYALWLDKLGQLVPREDTPHQAWGRRLEGVVADWIREVTAWPVVQAGAVLQSRPHPLLLADLDRWVVHPQYGRIPLEIKTTSPTQAAAWRDGPPPHVLAQVWHQCGVAGAPAAVVAVAIWGETPRWWVVEPSAADVADLVAREEAWWTTHVEGRVPPPVDDHPGTTAALDAAPHDGPALILPPVAWEWLRERARLFARPGPDEADADVFGTTPGLRRPAADRGAGEIDDAKGRHLGHEDLAAPGETHGLDHETQRVLGVHHEPGHALVGQGEILAGEDLAAEDLEDRTVRAQDVAEARRDAHGAVVPSAAVRGGDEALGHELARSHDARRIHGLVGAGDDETGDAGETRRFEHRRDPEDVRAHRLERRLLALVDVLECGGMKDRVNAPEMHPHRVAVAHVGDDEARPGIVREPFLETKNPVFVVIDPDETEIRIRRGGEEVTHEGAPDAPAGTGHAVGRRGLGRAHHGIVSTRASRPSARARAVVIAAATAPTVSAYQPMTSECTNMASVRPKAKNPTTTRRPMEAAARTEGAGSRAARTKSASGTP